VTDGQTDGRTDRRTELRLAVMNAYFIENGPQIISLDNNGVKKL